MIHLFRAKSAGRDFCSIPANKIPPFGHPQAVSISSVIEKGQVSERGGFDVAAQPSRDPRSFLLKPTWASLQPWWWCWVFSQGSQIGMANLGALPRLSALSAIPLQIETNLGFLSIYFFFKRQAF